MQGPLPSIPPLEPRHARLPEAVPQRGVPPSRWSGTPHDLGGARAPVGAFAALAQAAYVPCVPRGPQGTRAKPGAEPPPRHSLAGGLPPVAPWGVPAARSLPAACGLRAACSLPAQCSLPPVGSQLREAVGRALDCLRSPAPPPLCPPAPCMPLPALPVRGLPLTAGSSASPMARGALSLTPAVSGLSPRPRWQPSHTGPTWLAVDALRDAGNPVLMAAAASLSTAVARARAPATVKKYSAWVEQLAEFCERIQACSSSPVPTPPAVLALWVAALGDQGYAPSTIDGAVSAVAWAHRQEGLADPSQDAVVRLALDGAKRINARPVLKKDEFTLPQVCMLVTHLRAAGSFSCLRTAAMLATAFSCMLRPGELVVLKQSELTVSADCIAVYVRCAKNDQMHLGSTRYVPRCPSSDVCPYAVVVQYLARLHALPQPSDISPEGLPLWPALVGGHEGAVKWHRSISYDAATQLLHGACVDCGLDASRLSWHSCRSGGATAAYRGGAAPLTVQAAGNWRSDVYESYVRHDADHLLTASRLIWSAPLAAAPACVDACVPSSQPPSLRVPPSLREPAGEPSPRAPPAPSLPPRAPVPRVASAVTHAPAPRPREPAPAPPPPAPDAEEDASATVVVSTAAQHAELQARVRRARR